MPSNTVLTVTGINSGSADTVSTSANIPSGTRVTVFISEASGNCVGADLMLQVSHDNSTWYDTDARTGVLAARINDTFTLTSFAADYIRLIVKTASDVASTIDVIMQVK